MNRHTRTDPLHDKEPETWFSSFSSFKQRHFVDPLSVELPFYFSSMFLLWNQKFATQTIISIAADRIHLWRLTSYLNCFDGSSTFIAPDRFLSRLNQMSSWASLIIILRQKFSRKFKTMDAYSNNNDVPDIKMCITKMSD